jgi:hypothetical protein
MAGISRFFFSNRTGESVQQIALGKVCSLFLRGAFAQSGFDHSMRRMRYYHKNIAFGAVLTIANCWQL